MNKKQERTSSLSPKRQPPEGPPPTHPPPIPPVSGGGKADKVKVTLAENVDSGSDTDTNKRAKSASETNQPGRPKETLVPRSISVISPTQSNRSNSRSSSPRANMPPLSPSSHIDNPTLIKSTVTPHKINTQEVLDATFDNIEQTKDALKLYEEDKLLVVTGNMIKLLVLQLGLEGKDAVGVDNFVMTKVSMEATTARTWKQRLAIVNGLEACCKQLKSCLTWEEKLIKAQAAVKGRLARIRYKQLLMMYRDSSVANHLQNRNEVFRDIVISERNYLDNMQALLRAYYNPIMNEAEREKSLKHEISYDDINAIFSNITLLIGVNTKLLSMLEKEFENWPQITHVGQIFLEMAAMLRAYAEYSNNFQFAIQTLDRVCRESPKFKNFLTLCREAHGRKLYVQDFLALPLNRISQYDYLLETLISHTPVDYPDYNELMTAFSLVQGIGKKVGRNLERAGQRADILEVQRKLTGYDESLCKDARFFLKDGPVQLLGGVFSNTIRERHLFLFNDVILFAKPNEPPKPGYRYKGEILDVESLNIEDDETRPNAMLLTSGQKKMFCLFASEEDKAAWHNSITRAKQHTQVFGIDIDTLVTRSASGRYKFPAVLVEMLEHIRTTGLKVEGLFRVPGDRTEIETIASEFDKGVDVDLKKYDIHAVAGVLKKWVRELPKPLIPDDLYDEVIEIQENEDDSEQHAQVQALILKLPESHRAVVRVLVEFLREVAQNSDKNRMTTGNIATVFGPNLVHPPNDPAKYCQQINLVTDFVCGLMDNTNLQFNVKIPEK
eukprot:GFYU01005766.1.p1 GENE.GFYU01005766.1~~GFYU01005766.1.p1  ORF type:complete len:782 (+),score=213.83 GFYU01005766.1:184-2529(+)